MGGLSSDTWSIVFLPLSGWHLLQLFFTYLAIQFCLKISLLILVSLHCQHSTFIIAKESHSENYVDSAGIVDGQYCLHLQVLPDEKGNDLFIPSWGCKAEALEIVNGYRKIKTANGSVGWIAHSQIEIIWGTTLLFVIDFPSLMMKNLFVKRHAWISLIRESLITVKSLMKYGMPAISDLCEISENPVP